MKLFATSYVLPDLCERCTDGTSGCAHFDCEGGACVVRTCEQSPPPPPPTLPPGGCNAASDCTGALPSHCQTCKDGTVSCAHFACESHKCSVVTCS